MNNMNAEDTQRRVLLIQSWENKLHTQFDSTAEFMEKMGKVAKGKSWKPQDAQKLRRVRRKKKIQLFPYILGGIVIVIILVVLWLSRFSLQG